MPSDISRKTFNPRKSYSGVIMQQGRVQLDADWNEQLDIQLHRTHTENMDIVGKSGVPKGKPHSFEVKSVDCKLIKEKEPKVVQFDYTVSPGRIYVEGLLCESDEEKTFSEEIPIISFSNREGKYISKKYVIYLDAWQREVSYLDDDNIREKALNGVDTSTRLETVWQPRIRVSLKSDNKVLFFVNAIT